MNAQQYNALNGFELRVILVHELKQYAAEHPIFDQALQHEGVRGKVTIDCETTGSERQIGRLEVDFFTAGQQDPPCPINGRDMLAKLTATVDDYLTPHSDFKYALCHHNVSAKVRVEIETEKTLGSAKGKERSVAMKGDKKIVLTFERQYPYPDKAREDAGLVVPHPQMTQGGRNMSDFADDVDPFQVAR